MRLPKLDKNFVWRWTKIAWRNIYLNKSSPYYSKKEDAIANLDLSESAGYLITVKAERISPPTYGPKYRILKLVDLRK